ncbi:MAG: tetratricopeptide repeat protein [Pseudomonadota bacterium]
MASRASARKRAAATKRLGGAALIAVVAAQMPAGASAQDLRGLLASCSNPKTSPAEALRLCDMADEVGGERLNDQNRARVVFNAGVAALDLGRLSIALSRLDRAVALDPAMAAARVSRAQVREQRGDPAGALEDYAAAIENDPAAAAPYLARGRLLARLGSPAEAVADFNAALEREGDWPASYLGRGRALMMLGDFTGAEADFTAVIARAPRDASGWLGRGEARALMGQPSAANDLDRAIALAPEWGLAWLVRGRFREMNGDPNGAEADFLRAYELGMRAPDLNARVEALSGG